MTYHDKTLAEQLADAEADMQEAKTRAAKWDDRHAATDIGTPEAELASRRYDRAMADLRDGRREVIRIKALIDSQPKFATMHATCEDCGQPATFTWHSGPATNGGVEVSFGQCNDHAISGGQPGIDTGYLTRNY